MSTMFLGKPSNSIKERIIQCLQEKSSDVQTVGEWEFKGIPEGFVVSGMSYRDRQNYSEWKTVLTNEKTSQRYSFHKTDDDDDFKSLKENPKEVVLYLDEDLADEDDECYEILKNIKIVASRNI